MALYEQPSSRSGSRFGRYSSNMFFTRNTAKPKRVRHIEGLNGALICSVNDDPEVTQPSPLTSLGFTKPYFHVTENTRRVERFIPPTSFWNTYGVIRDTERWRRELASLATASGLGSGKDYYKHHNRPVTSNDQQSPPRSGAHYSNRTGRFNEGAAKSRGRSGSKHGTNNSDILLHVPEHERESWMLQVLCQLLGTTDFEEIQSWLVSAPASEKEQARIMIHSALRGLKESERGPNESDQPVDLYALSNFVEKQKSEERQSSKKFIKETLDRSQSTLQTTHDEPAICHELGDSWQNLIKNSQDSSPSNTTPYKRTYHNYNRRAFSSFDVHAPANQIQEEEEQQCEEQIDPFQSKEDDNQPIQTASLSKPKSPSKQLQTPLRQAPPSNQSKHRVESIQFNDDNNDGNINNDNVIQNRRIDDYEFISEEQLRNEFVLPPIKIKSPLNEDENLKSRQIRDLQHRLSRQEEEARKQISELQLKQSRLENALKLLTQKSPSRGTHRPLTSDNADNSDSSPHVHTSASQKENDRRSFSRRQDSRSSDIRPSKSSSGIWKPDASLLHRLQEN